MSKYTLIGPDQDQDDLDVMTAYKGLSDLWSRYDVGEIDDPGSVEIDSEEFVKEEDIPHNPDEVVEERYGEHFGITLFCKFQQDDKGGKRFIAAYEHNGQEIPLDEISQISDDFADAIHMDFTNCL